MNETKKSPLYKNVIYILEEQGVNFKTVIKVPWLEEQLQSRCKTVQFNGAVHKIRRHFIPHGMFLTCRGQRGEQYIFAEPGYNHAIIAQMQAKAFRALKTGTILGTNTPMDSMDAEEAKRHERALAQISLRLAFVRKPQTTLKLINKSMEQKKVA